MSWCESETVHDASSTRWRGKYLLLLPRLEQLHPVRKPSQPTFLTSRCTRPPLQPPVQPLSHACRGARSMQEATKCPACRCHAP